jgi:RNA recognition motif-containing protein
MNGAAQERTVPKTLYIGNLTYGVADEDLRRLVSAHAEVVSARVATERDTGRSRGFGFVEVPEEAAEAVIAALNGTMHEGRTLTVNEARPKGARPVGGRFEGSSSGRSQGNGGQRRSADRGRW